MGTDRVEVTGCKDCPFCVCIVEGVWCQHPIQMQSLMIPDKIRHSGSSPENCPLGEVLIVKTGAK